MSHVVMSVMKVARRSRIEWWTTYQHVVRDTLNQKRSNVNGQIKDSFYGMVIDCLNLGIALL